MAAALELVGWVRARLEAILGPPRPGNASVVVMESGAAASDAPASVHRNSTCGRGTPAASRLTILKFGRAMKGRQRSKAAEIFEDWVSEDGLRDNIGLGLSSKQKREAGSQEDSRNLRGRANGHTKV